MTIGNGNLNPDRLFSSDPSTRKISREIYQTIENLPIISPHGHTDPLWFSNNKPFPNPTNLFLTPDHYFFRMLHSQGINLDDLNIPRLDNNNFLEEKSVWKKFMENYYIFFGTPSDIWFRHSLSAVFDINEEPNLGNADIIYDKIQTKLQNINFRPRALLDRFNVEVIATTEMALDDLVYHKKLKDEDMIGKIISTYRPDDVTDPDLSDFEKRLEEFGLITNENTFTWKGMVNAHRIRRKFFREYGATATDHGFSSFITEDLNENERQTLLDKALNNKLTKEESAIFKGQILMEMAGLSVEDGMVMQIHTGSYRNYDNQLMIERGPNMGCDIPICTEFTNNLNKLLNRYGHSRNLKIILFTLDETTYSRELAPLAGYWQCLRIGPPWWFYDSPNGIKRFLNQIVETAGFYNLSGFNDDTRAFLSIPSRHDVWRREVSNFLAQMVVEYRMNQNDANKVASDLSYGIAKKLYNLN